MGRVISIVQCVSKKKDTPQLARNLYISNLFINASSYVEKISDEWYIISAKYGLVHPSDLLEPYNETLKNMSVREREVWSEQVFSDLKPILKATDTVVILAGVIYRENLVKKIEELGCKVEIPMEGLRIGEQVHWLQHKLEDK